MVGRKKTSAPGPPSPKWFTIGANMFETYRTSLTYSKIICQIACVFNEIRGFVTFFVTKKGFGKVMLFCGFLEGRKEEENCDGISLGFEDR